MQQYRALILRSNRFLGSSLVEKGLLNSEDLEAANLKFMDQIQSPDSLRNASILSTILFDQKSLEESKLVEQIVEECKVGLIDLAQFQLSSLRPTGIDLDACVATWTLPFDVFDGTYMLATCYYLSAPVIKYWEDQLDGNIIWYVTSVAAMVRALENIQDIHEAEDAAAAEAAAEEAEAAANEARSKALASQALKDETEGEDDAEKTEST